MYSEQERYKIEKFLHNQLFWKLRKLMKHIIRNKRTRRIYNEIVALVEKTGFKYGR